MSKFLKRYKLAVYLLIGALGLIALILSKTEKGFDLSGFLLNIGTELIGGMFIFLILDWFYLSDKHDKDLPKEAAFDEINGQISKILSLVGKDANIEIINGAKDITIKGAEITNKVKRNIRATNFSKNISPVNDYTKTLAKKLKESLDANG